MGELNGQHVKLVKAQGVFDWHNHAHEDELFLVIRGEFTMDLRDGPVRIREGELIIIPKAPNTAP